MKSSKSIRIGMMSVIALVAFGFASKAMAAVDTYLWFKASDGKVTRVLINHDGTFHTPPLAAGTYSFSWGVARPVKTGGSADRESSSPSVSELTSRKAGERPHESISLNFTKIEWTYQVQTPVDVAHGAVTHRRQHGLLTVTKEIDKASPKLMTNLGTVVIDQKGESVSGSIMGMSKGGGKSAADAWDTK